MSIKKEKKYVNSYFALKRFPLFFFWKYSVYTIFTYRVYTLQTRHHVLRRYPYANRDSIYLASVSRTIFRDVFISFSPTAHFSTNFFLSIRVVSLLHLEFHSLAIYLRESSSLIRPSSKKTGFHIRVYYTRHRRYLSM